MSAFLGSQIMVLSTSSGDPSLLRSRRITVSLVVTPSCGQKGLNQQVGRDLENGKRIIPNFKLSEETKKDLLNKKIIATGLEVINNKIVGRYLSVYENK